MSFDVVRLSGWCSRGWLVVRRSVNLWCLLLYLYFIPSAKPLFHFHLIPPSISVPLPPHSTLHLCFTSTSFHPPSLFHLHLIHPPPLFHLHLIPPSISVPSPPHSTLHLCFTSTSFHPPPLFHLHFIHLPPHSICHLIPPSISLPPPPHSTLHLIPPSTSVPSATSFHPTPLFFPRVTFKHIIYTTPTYTGKRNNRKDNNSDKKKCGIWKLL
ncbi:hypothetical protein Pmani_014626 [Petrolisthes manimaculis]|uniref:Uncharacterized protein n=1 Tax=Petrolisthes manimaculis TaxID=1843537 RepID=A0AAE1PTL1_9EUCA|nr:hypothetical protein Pmani_014626 [Petrolisthes manimaculis]